MRTQISVERFLCYLSLCNNSKIVLSVGNAIFSAYPVQTFVWGGILSDTQTENSARLSSVLCYISGKRHLKAWSLSEWKKPSRYKFLRKFLKTQIKDLQAVIFQKIHKLSQDVRKPFCVRKQYIQIERLRILKTSTKRDFHKVVVICVLCPSVLSVRSPSVSATKKKEASGIQEKAKAIFLL